MNESQRFTQPDDEADLRRLLQEAGPRPEVPAEELAVLRAAARQAWRQTLAERGATTRTGWTPRRLALAASLLVAVALGWWWVLRPAPVGTVELVRGVAEWSLQSPGPARGSVVLTGTEISTSEGSAVALRLAGGQSLRLDGATRIRVDSPARVELDHGAVYLDSEVTTAVEIATPYGIVRDVGTQFEVRLGAEHAALRVRVREGEVALVRVGESRAVRRGEELVVDAGGAVEVVPLTAGDSDWRWMLEAAPGPDIEGMPLPRFLAWVSRETGWTIGFTDPALAREIESIVLHGTIEGLTPEEALAVVIPGSGLGYVREGDAVRIRPGPE
jgi:ferric-dicitrate binding protein FerR (iron transport regulator)